MDQNIWGLRLRIFVFFLKSQVSLMTSKVWEPLVQDKEEEADGFQMSGGSQFKQGASVSMLLQCAE